MSGTSDSGRRSVIACDSEGTPTGTVGLLQAHQGEGVLHKAFSVFVFRNAGAEVLLQQRSRYKKLFALRWANTCCSHPAPHDGVLAAAAERRLREELGFTVPVREAGSFVYRAADPDVDLSEYEHDTVLLGEAAADVPVRPDPAEVADWRWVPVGELQLDLLANAERYAPWLPEALRVALGAVTGSVDAKRENG